MATATVTHDAEQPQDVIVRRALTVTERAETIQIKTIVDRARAAELGLAISQLDKEAEDFFGPMKKAAKAVHTEICNKENSVREPLKTAKQKIAGLIGTFDQEQERLRRAEEARLQAEADKAAQEEADRIAQEQAIQDAIALEAAGDKKGAEAVLNNPVPIQPVSVPVVLQRQTVKTAGVSSAGTWEFIVEDESQIPRQYLVVDQKQLDQIARASKEKTNIPGGRAHFTPSARFARK